MFFFPLHSFLPFFFKNLSIMGHERMEELRGKIATDSFEMHYFAVPKFFSSEYQQLALVR